MGNTKGKYRWRIVHHPNPAILADFIGHINDELQLPADLFDRRWSFLEDRPGLPQRIEFDLVAAKPDSEHKALRLTLDPSFPPLAMQGPSRPISVKEVILVERLERRPGVKVRS